MFSCLKTWSQSQTVFERHWHKGREQINEDSNIDCIQSTVHISALHGSFKNSCFFLSKFLISSLFTQKKYNFSLYKDTYGQSTIMMKRKMYDSQIVAFLIWFPQQWQNILLCKIKNAFLCFRQFRCKRKTYQLYHFNQMNWNCTRCSLIGKLKWSVLRGHTVKQTKCTKYQSLISFLMVVYIQTRRFYLFCDYTAHNIKMIHVPSTNKRRLLPQSSIHRKFNSTRT